MPPAPKPAATRQRTNPPRAGVRVFPPGGPGLRVPALPARRGPRWLKRTRDWWAAVWRSPVASAYLEADREALLRIAVLVDEFWRTYDARILAELRLQEARFGLSPLDRRRLEWEVRPAAEPSSSSGSERPSDTKPAVRRRRRSDPRRALQAVK